MQESQRVVSPSERDGLTPEQVAAFKRTAINTIIVAGARLNMEVDATAAGCVFLHRFYASKSLVRNDPFLFGCACLYLGGKVKDSPKSVRDVLMACCEQRFRDAARRVAHERDLYERMREQVFVAERALLYALDFDFEVETPHQQFVKLFNTEPLRSALLPCPRWHKQIGPLINLLVNDSVKTEACLRYRGRQLVVGVTWLALKLLKEDTKIYTDKGQLWWVAEGMRAEDLEAIEAHMQALYDRDLYALAANKDLVAQSVGLLSPAALAAARAPEQQQPAQATQQQVAAGALPADVAAANRASWELAAAQAAAQAAAAAGAGVQQEQEQAEADDDLDHLLDDYE